MNSNNLMKLAAVVLAIGLSSLTALAQESGEIVDRISYVSDYAELYSEEHEADLNALFEALLDQQQLEIDLLTVESTGELSISEYGDEILTQWGISDFQNLRRHLLIIIAVEDGTYNIMTTDALERYLPDSVLQRINENVIIPEAESRSIQAAMIVGIEEMIDSYMQAVENETPVHTASGATGMSFADWMGILTIVGGVIVLMLLNHILGGI